MAYFGHPPGDLPPARNYGFTPKVVYAAHHGYPPSGSSTDAVNYGFCIPPSSPPSPPYPLPTSYPPPYPDPTSHFPPYPSPEAISPASPPVFSPSPYPPFVPLSPPYPSPEIYPPHFPVNSDGTRERPDDKDKDNDKDNDADVCILMKFKARDVAHRQHSKEDQNYYRCNFSSADERQEGNVIECSAGNTHHHHAKKDSDRFCVKEESLIDKLEKVTLQCRGSHQKKGGSTWFTDLEGNVKISEICYYSVTGTCRNEEVGCDRLHVDQSYFWQFSIHGGKWLNLPLSLVNFLEREYTDPAQESVSLPRMDEGFGNAEIRQLLPLQERDSWTVNLQTMCLVNSERSLLYRLRRLHIERIPGEVNRSNNFVWYIQDSNSEWVEFGKANTTGKRNMVSGITSDNIEHHFLTIPDIPLTFTVSNITYTLDTKRMTQTNTSTGAVLEVRRRPWDSQAIKQKQVYGKQLEDMISYYASIFSETYLKSPASWEIMDPNEKSRRVPLLSSSEEYRKVVDVLKGEISTARISKVERIQNPYLWRAFRNKVNEMTSTYGSTSLVNIRQLFHGTRSVVIDNIINENFDWRLHGTSTGQVHGQGTYFSTKASESYRYCKPDDQGNRYIFIALVAVGTITEGDATMTRPPINPSTNAPYDSTGSGSIIVKYDKQEYYPEYILTLED